MAMLMTFKSPPNDLIISPIEFALKTNISAIPTCISDFFSVCVYGVFRKDMSRYPGNGFSDIMSNTNTTPLLEMPRLTSSLQRCFPMSLQTEYRSGYVGSKISNFYYRVLKIQSLLKPTLNISLSLLLKKVPKTID